jgi:histidine triad (HIT) family protein
MDPADPCPFCQVAASETYAGLVAYRTENVYVLPALKQRVRNHGHVLVLPVRHVVDLAGADAPLRHELFDVVASVSAAVPRAFGAVGSLVFQNNSAPDQVLMHLHVHVVPRFADDGFRLPDPTVALVDDATRRAQAQALAQALKR